MLEEVVFQSSFHRAEVVEATNVTLDNDLSILFSSSNSNYVIRFHLHKSFQSSFHRDHGAVFGFDDVLAHFQSSFHRGWQMAEQLFSNELNFQSSFHRVADF